MQTRPFKQIDVFTATPYFGNPLAVVLDAAGLDDAAMRRFANWTNLSETTFLLPPRDASADYAVRIFTPGGELPFAGHPTLGSCHAWLQAGGKAKRKDVIVQECQVGLVQIRQEKAGQRLAFAAPPLKRSAPSPVLLAQVAAALGLKAAQITAAQTLDNGPVWMGLLLDSPETVLQLAPNNLELGKLNVKIGVAGLYEKAETTPLIGRANREARAFAPTLRTGVSSLPPAGAELARGGPSRRSAASMVASTEAGNPDIEVRAFAPGIGINEDPVTGSFNAGLAQWLMADGYAPENYVASQGVCLNRAGLVYLDRDANGQVWVGGESVTCIDGNVTL
ncbi:MAG: PhzF family phenazine biosynthesis protein [Polaromonas sp.]|uniref:PhzF family phenazine biosynthesis protein n=1 Tax=Polaromonas sp. TaxID=1869339 RepID=UPI0025DCA51D|nr:PhzF family phenazine biosynthesis protein [Polaromonas sp.]MBI2728011.1 PhzF family phenazine biosynthesis protein [Polaromonas sp.]